MTSELESKCHVVNVGDIVNKTKILIDKLRLAVIHQDNLTKDCFDTTASELSKTVDSVKKTYKNLEEEYQTVKEDVKAGEIRLNNILQNYNSILEENQFLKETEDGLMNQANVYDQYEKTAEELTKKLKTYKLLTGVRFDFDESDTILSGYIGISGDSPSNSTLIPFEIEKDNTDSQLLWKKISEACTEVTQC